MIPWNIQYIQPESLSEAWQAFQNAKHEGREVYYLNGGTELITYARQNKLHPEVLIDISRLPELKRLEQDRQWMIYGSALTLNDVIEAKCFPLLEHAAAITDHTVRNKLSLGGNIAGRLPYRETVLPFLVSDATVSIYGKEGIRQIPIEQVFSKRLLLENGEILVDLRLERSILARPWAYVRKTRFGQNVDYPLVTLVFLDVGEKSPRFRCAVSGAFSAPVRSGAVEDALHTHLANLSPENVQMALDPQFIHQLIDLFGFPLVQDQRAGADYRRMLLQESLEAGLTQVLQVNNEEGRR